MQNFANIFKGFSKQQQEIPKANPKAKTLQKPIQHYVNMQRYNRQLPAFLNCHYNINLIDAVDSLPQLGKQKLKLSKQLQFEKIDMKKQPLKIQERLQKITLVTIHQIDKLNQDIFVNDYQFTKNVLGRGAHSVVRLAKKNNVNYAIKIIQLDKVRKKYFIKQESLIKMINMQGKILRKLIDCQNIVMLHETLYSIEKQKVFVVLEYCEKGSLLKIAQNQGNFNRKNRQKTDKWISKIQSYFKQLVNAVFQMHQRNIIHRDIKPQNVLLTLGNCVKVIDFNISQQVSENGLIKVYTGKFTGTKGYAAPQLLISNGLMQRQVNGKALDIWALAITLLQVLQNKHPLQCRSLETLQSSIQKQIPLNVNYPEQLKKLLRGMLQKNPEKRWNIGDILASTWISDPKEIQYLNFQTSFKRQQSSSELSNSVKD